MVKVKIPEKFCRFTFYPLRPLLRSPFVLSLCLYLYLSPSLAIIRCVPTVAFSFFPRARETSFSNACWKRGTKRHPCRIDMVTARSDFRLLSLSSPFRFPSVSFFVHLHHQSLVPSDSMSRRRCLRHLYGYLSIFPLSLSRIWSLSTHLSPSLTFVALDEELEANRAYTTHFTSLIRNNS